MATDLNLPARSDATVRELFEAEVIQKQIARALPSFLTVERLTRIMLTVFRTNQDLLKCSQKSLLACFFGCAQLGLTPEPWLGQAYLVPFWNTKLNSLEATLIPGYRGLITLARRSGEVKTVKAAAVYENEPFNWDRMWPERSMHGYVEKHPGELKGSWTIWTYADGYVTGDYMTLWEIDQIMERTKSRNRKGEIVGPWITDKPAMAIKSVIRRHFKLSPVSVEDMRMNKAINADDLIEIGKDQRGLFLPDMAPPEPKYTPEDFDAEFSLEAKEATFNDFFVMGKKANEEIAGGPMTDEEFKVAIMKDSAENFRDAFIRYKAAASAKDAAPAQDDKGASSTKKPTKTPPKKTTAKKSAAKGTAAAEKSPGKGNQAPAKGKDAGGPSFANADEEFNALVDSDEWQELSALKSEHPQVYKEESGGKDPRTFGACNELIDKISARIGGDEIPE